MIYLYSSEFQGCYNANMSLISFFMTSAKWLQCFDVVEHPDILCVSVYCPHYGINALYVEFGFLSAHI